MGTDRDFLTFGWNEKQVPLRWPWRIHGGAQNHGLIKTVSLTWGDQTGIGEVSGPSTWPAEEYKWFWDHWSRWQWGPDGPLFQEALKELLEQRPRSFLRKSSTNPKAWLKKLGDLLDKTALPDAQKKQADPFCNENAQNPISFFPNFRCGLELAILNWVARVEKTSIPKILGLPAPLPHATSFSVPLMELKDLPLYFKTFALDQFSTLKVKITENTSEEFLKELTVMHKGQFRLDGNQCFKNPDQVLRFIDHHHWMLMELMEQPLPKEHWNAHRDLKNRCPLPLIADESFQKGSDFIDLQQGFHGINVKLMKSGGILPALDHVSKAKDHGLEVMLGCMLESSQSIGFALNLAHEARWVDLDGCLFLKEDPFQRIAPKPKGFIAPHTSFLAE